MCEARIQVIKGVLKWFGGFVDILFIYLFPFLYLNWDFDRLKLEGVCYLFPWEMDYIALNPVYFKIREWFWCSFDVYLREENDDISFTVLIIENVDSFATSA